MLATFCGVRSMGRCRRQKGIGKRAVTLRVTCMEMFFLFLLILCSGYFRPFLSHVIAVWCWLYCSCCSATVVFHCFSKKPQRSVLMLMTRRSVIWRSGKNSRSRRHSETTVRKAFVGRNRTVSVETDRLSNRHYTNCCCKLL